MKKCFVLGLAVLFVATSAFGANFAPTLLKISANPQVQYNFDGKDLTLPVTVSGTAASVTFLVFTKDKAAGIKSVKNGHLGWHYVNKIDTCMYVSPAYQFVKGQNAVTWNGKDETGAQVAPGTYTYYLWGFDNVNPKVKATDHIQSAAHNMFLRIQQYGADGKPLAQPIVYRSRDFRKWTLGNDPEDKAFLETTKVTLPGSLAQAMAPVFDPKNFNNIFIEIGNTDAKQHGIAKYKWVPNGDAQLLTEWAEQGLAVTNAAWGGGNADAGVETDGSYLYTVTGIHYTTEAEADLRVWDLDGTLVKKFDLTPWWSSVEAAQNGGQMNGGPNTLYNQNGLIYLNCHCSCLAHVVNPVMGLEDEADLTVWTNGNGDYVLDHNFEESAARKWMCNDYNVGPYTYTLVADANQFSLSPSYDMGGVSFGLVAPDGTGIGYMAFAGETAGLKYGQYFVDNGSQFDGLYSDNNNGTSGNVGLWFTGSDSFKGVISKEVSVTDAAPAAFSVAQNTPNPFNPTTTISFTLAKAGHTTVEVFNVAGQRVDTIVNSNMSAGSHSVTWNAAKFSAGVYFYTVKSGSFSKTVKMTLLK